MGRLLVKQEDASEESSTAAWDTLGSSSLLCLGSLISSTRFSDNMATMKCLKMSANETANSIFQK